MEHLQSGITLQIIPTKKYKTTRLFIRFTSRHTADEATKRTLLTSLLETNSKQYPTQTVLSKKLAELYGASFGINVAKKGNLHQVNVGLTLVNGKYIADESLLLEGIDFLETILFEPNTTQESFDEATFLLEKENLLAYLESISEDKQTYASLKLQELYFSEDAEQKVPSFGDAKRLATLTAAQLYQTHQEMLQNDHIDIFVVGDVDSDSVRQRFAEWKFPATKRVHPELYVDVVQNNIIKENILREPVTQAKLNLGYRSGVYYESEQRMAFTVFNGLFGGFPHSKLFTNVREKASLAYYASSSIDTFRGMVTVQTGIDSQNRERVMKLIHEQLLAIQQGDISEKELMQTKEMLKNQYLLSQDYVQALIEQQYLATWLPHTKRTEEQVIKEIMAVTKKDVQKIAKNLELHAVFCLEGDSHNGEN
ncbi:EF-P 5-aminopentanol modification-associated protein YfmF [uncultured Enterococcus sp.]|uniref:EF-P 5-aminopentanol modification-associated protein YfmF n=1 Tax=uncultured Enterococcus sp. TaxID=167972 RepID=UPI0025F86E2B|nr:pitrilysin family protein [uncultured Enterococcus sp.]